VQTRPAGGRWTQLATVPSPRGVVVLPIPNQPSPSTFAWSTPVVARSFVRETRRRPWSEAEPQRNPQGEDRIARSKAATIPQQVPTQSALSSHPESQTQGSWRRVAGLAVPTLGAAAAASTSPRLAGRLERLEEGWTGVSGPRSGFCGRRRFLPASSCAALYMR